MEPLHRKKRQLRIRRYAWFHQAMMPIMVVAVIVVAVVLAVPAKLVGSLNYLEVIDDTLFYEVYVADPDYQIVSQSLFLRIDHPLDRRDIALSPGVDRGQIEDLRPSSRYKVSLHVSQGYGEEILARATIDTSTQSLGAIVDVTFSENTSDQTWMIIATVLQSQATAFTSITADVVWTDHDFYTESTTFTINQRFNTLMITTVPLWLRGSLDIQLIGHHPEDGPIIIDQLTVQIPFAVYTSFIIDAVGSNTIDCTVYPDAYLLDARYTLILKKADREQAKHVLAFTEIEAAYWMGTHRFGRLEADTLYYIELWIDYIDPYTMQAHHRMLERESVQTLAVHHIDIDYQMTADFHQFLIETRDPHAVVHNIRVLVYDITGSHELFIGSYSTDSIEQDSDGHTTRVINVPFSPVEALLFRVVADYASRGEIQYFFNTIERFEYRD